MVDFRKRKDADFSRRRTYWWAAKWLEPSVLSRGLGDWSTFTARFTGTAANAGEPITIQLRAPAFEGNFDNVRLSVTPVPEPAFLGVVGMGLTGLLALARRNRSA